MVVEMENSRRPFDRSRDPSQMKKPRLSEESTRPVNSNVRQLSSQKTLGSVNASQASSRFRVSGRELESSSGDPSREAYQPQPVDPHYELVNQYKLALSDLTFNSKLIITNLTVIAGENVHAAKAVVGTICNHILEVPSEQKLPALYLLDSIVKNIGRDYIKYFAARLPEVFLKAYRHVEPPMQSNMRHLFRTWKGVFHPQTLQLIEKELSVNSRSDGSTDVVTTTSADTQSHRPHHSIHVNPKYLERQRLQQSGQTKGIVNDVLGITPNLIRESDRLERVSSGASGDLWMDSAVKVNTIRRPQRDSHSEPLYEKDIVSMPGEYDFASDLPQNSRSVIKKIGSRFTDDVYEKPWYGDISRGPDLISDQRDGLHTKSKVSNYRAARLENTSSSGLSRNSVPYDSWKNSEEEEFMWDMHSRLSETDVATINPNNESENHILRRPRFPVASSRFDMENATDSYSTEPKDPSLYDQWMSSPRSLHDSEVFSSIGATSTAPGKRIQTQARVAGSGIQNSVSGSDRQSLLQDSTCIQNVTKQDFARTHTLPRRDPRTARFSAKSQTALRDDSVRPLPSSSPLKNTNIHEVPDASQVESFVSKSTAENVPGLGSKVPGQPNMSDLLEAVMKTGILSNTSTCGASKDESSQGKVNAGALTLSEASRSKALPPPLPVSLAGGNLLARLEVEKSSSPLPVQTSKENNSKSSDPLSHLLSSLVSKGLISASNAKKPSLAQSAAPSVTQDPSTASVAPSDAQPSVLLKKAPSTTPKVKELVAAPSETIKPGSEGLIGLKFRAEKLRELHPSVISSLFDDLPYYCTSCGIRVKEKEEHDTHMELHNKKRLESSDTNSKCRVWFPKADDWLAAKALEVEAEAESEEVLSESESGIKDGAVVVADENQCACILCGEIFEDYFSQETGRWMFKGASYLTVPPASNDDNAPIVHFGCLTKNSTQSLGFGIAIKEENAD